MAKFFRGDKRRREMDRKRRGEEKQRRLQFRREMRAKGLDPDMVDADGNPLPGAVGAAPGEEDAEGAEESAGSDESDEEPSAPGPGEHASGDVIPAADRTKP